MPYRSEKQRAYMHIHHPAIAARWDRKYGGKIAPKGDRVTQALRKKKR
jgi:hypothetical protein